MMYRIDDEFRAYLPPQTDEETAALKAKILDEGAMPGSLVVGVLPEGALLIDGHHTLAICEANDIEPPEPRQIVFADRAAVLAWMRKNQLARRNLTDKQRSYYIGKEYEFRKNTHGGSRSSCQSGNLKTDQQIADENKTSAQSVHRSAEFAQAVDKVSGGNPKVTEEILKSETPKTVVIAAAKTRCSKCARIWPNTNQSTPDCPQCAEAAAAAIKKPKAKPKPLPMPVDDTEPAPRHKSGSANASEPYDVKFERHYDALLGVLGERAVAMGKDKFYTDCLGSLVACRKLYKQWVSA